MKALSFDLLQCLGINVYFLKSNKLKKNFDFFFFFFLGEVKKGY